MKPWRKSGQLCHHPLREPPVGYPREFLVCGCGANKECPECGIGWRSDVCLCDLEGGGVRDVGTPDRFYDSGW